MINLTTKLKAYPRMEPSILKGYVKEVENPQEGVIYGRTLLEDEMVWVDINNLNNIILCNIVNKQDITEEDVLDFLSPTKISDNKYRFTIAPENNGYLYIVSAKPVSSATFISQVPGFNTTESLIDKGIIDVTLNNIKTSLHCYRTSTKYVALGELFTWDIVLN